MKAEAVKAETGLSREVGLARICRQRDEAIALAAEGMAKMLEGRELTRRASKLARLAADDCTFSIRDRTKDAKYGQLFPELDEAESLRVFREATDAAIWVHLLKATGMEGLMDSAARKEFLDGLSTSEPCPICPHPTQEERKREARARGTKLAGVLLRKWYDEDCPVCKGTGRTSVVEVTEDNVNASLASLHSDARRVFLEGVSRAFAGLDRRFLSHDVFKFKSRVILPGLASSDGWLSHYGDTWAKIQDIERVFATLDEGAEFCSTGLYAAIEESRRGSYGPRQTMCETPYLRIRIFKNGNAHLWFRRKDLVERVNLILAEFYGKVLPDGEGKRKRPSNIPNSGLPCKNLAFYPTPIPVVHEAIGRSGSLKGLRILEPSAGSGNICRVLLERGATVDAIELHAGRVRELRQIKGLTVFAANFLEAAPVAIYDLVIMNPPFSGTHWMEHVVAAKEWLKPGGRLIAILPATAYVGTSPAQVEFRKWAEENRTSSYARQFRALPTGSFKSSGTNVSTVVFEL